MEEFRSFVGREESYWESFRGSSIAVMGASTVTCVTRHEQDGLLMVRALYPQTINSRLLPRSRYLIRSCGGTKKSTSFMEQSWWNTSYTTIAFIGERLYNMYSPLKPSQNPPFLSLHSSSDSHSPNQLYRSESSFSPPPALPRTSRPQSR